MKFRALALGCAILFSSTAYAEMVTIPNGTVVPVKTTVELKGNNLKEGQPVNDIVVAMDVSIHGKVVIKSGTPVLAQVSTADSNGMVGQAGKISINLQATTATDGATVPLSGALMTKADSEVGGTVAVSVILCPLAALHKGDEAVIPAGAQTRGMTIGAVETSVN